MSDYNAVILSCVARVQGGFFKNGEITQTEAAKILDTYDKDFDWISIHWSEKPDENVFSEIVFERSDLIKSILIIDLVHNRGFHGTAKEQKWIRGQELENLRQKMGEPAGYIVWE